MNPELTMIFKALDFAACKHRDQRRKDHHSTPYINHPIAVARILVEEGNVTDEVTLAAAILHDTIEDTETSFAELVDGFGLEIADVVQEVTDDKSLEKAERKSQQVEKAPRLSERAKLVKLADKTCNLRDIVSAPPKGWGEERKSQYFQWADDVVMAMGVVNSPMFAVFKKARAARGKGGV